MAVTRSCCCALLLVPTASVVRLQRPRPLPSNSAAMRLSLSSRLPSSYPSPARAGSSIRRNYWTRLPPHGLHLIIPPSSGCAPAGPRVKQACSWVPRKQRGMGAVVCCTGREVLGVFV